MNEPTPLQQALNDRDLRHHQVAAELGVDSSVVSRWATGRRTPRLHHAQALCRLLEKDINTLWPDETKASRA